MLNPKNKVEDLRFDVLSKSMDRLADTIEKQADIINALHARIANIEANVEVIREQTATKRQEVSE